MTFPGAGEEAWAALAEKYVALLELRRGRAPAAGELRALARRHPGVLRELDRLTEAELERRLAASQAAARGEAVAPWVGALEAYHRVWRAVLAARRRRGQGRSVVVDVLRRELTELPDDDELVDHVSGRGVRSDPVVRAFLVRQGVDEEALAIALDTDQRR